MKILIINGPNINMLGARNKKHYGVKTLTMINNKLKTEAAMFNISLDYYQSNHEGSIIDFIQKNAPHSDGIIINPGALTHYGYSLRDACQDCQLPIVEVHLSDIGNREEFRKINVLKSLPVARFIGLKDEGYIRALRFLIKFLKKENK